MQNGADETFRIGQGVCFPTGMRPFEDFFVLVQVCFKLIKKSKTQFYMHKEVFKRSHACWETNSLTDPEGLVGAILHGFAKIPGMGSSASEDRLGSI